MKTRIIIQHGKYIPEVKLSRFSFWKRIGNLNDKIYGNILITDVGLTVDPIVCDMPDEAREILERYVRQESDNNKIVWTGKVYQSV